MERMPFQLVGEKKILNRYEQVVVAETVDDGNIGFRTLTRYWRFRYSGKPCSWNNRDPTNPKKKLL